MPRPPPTLAEVARRAGVSRMTASRALNDRPGVSREVRGRIVRLAAEIGYVLNRPAQKLSGGRSRVIGLVAVQMYSQFVSEVVAGALRTARAAGYEMLMYSLLDPDDRLPGGVTQLIGQKLIFANGKQVPLAFEVEYPIEQIDPTHVYTLQARITLGNQPLFDTPQPIAVLTAGNPVTNVEIVVQPVQ